MRATEIKYERLVNTGNFSHERYEITVSLEEGESASLAINNAKKVVEKQIFNPSEAERLIQERVNAFDEEPMPI